MILKHLDEIFQSGWENLSEPQIFPTRTPAKWPSHKKLTLEEVKIWEQIYHRPGAIGVYASWDPYEDFYIITHNLHLNSRFIEEYQGQSAVDDVIDRCRNFGVEIQFYLIS